jgi:hypothetical protein
MARMSSVKAQAGTRVTARPGQQAAQDDRQENGREGHRKRDRQPEKQEIQMAENEDERLDHRSPTILNRASRMVPSSEMERLITA